MKRYISLIAFLVLTISPAFAGTTGSIAGTVTDERGKPLADVTVSIESPAFIAERKTDARGFYVFPDIAPGPVKVAFYKMKYEVYAATGQVAADTQTILDVCLKAAPTIIITLTDHSSAWFSLGFARVDDRYSVRPSSPVSGGPDDAARALRGVPGITVPLSAPPRVVY